ncbi:hypothetical protein C8R45DRAFT_1208626 [Mycena sanguinolenta]|nr:hypothetical protein C8R45DRAFT_1208626 [Mycena sanguinolenta]
MPALTAVDLLRPQLLRNPPHPNPSTPSSSGAPTYCCIDSGARTYAAVYIYIVHIYQLHPMTTQGSCMQHGTHTSCAITVHMGSCTRCRERESVAVPTSASQTSNTLNATVMHFCTLYLEVPAAPFAWRRPHRKRESRCTESECVRAAHTAHRALAGTHWAVLNGIGRAERTLRVCTTFLWEWERVRSGLRAAKAVSARCRRERLANAARASPSRGAGGRRSAANDSAALRRVATLARRARFLYPAAKTLSRRPSHRVGGREFTYLLLCVALFEDRSLAGVRVRVWSWMRVGAGAGNVSPAV